MRGALLYGSISAFAIGVIAQDFVEVSLSIRWLLFFVACSSLVFAALNQSLRGAMIGCLSLFFLMGILRMAYHTQSQPLVSQNVFDMPITLEGRVFADPDVRETTTRLSVEVSLNHVRTKIIAVVPVYETYYVGERIQVSGKIARPAPFLTDSGRTFAYDKFLALNGIVGIIQPAQVRVLGPPTGFFFKSWGALLAIKYDCIKALGVTLPQPYSSLAVGLIAGGKQGLGPELLQVFTVAGLLPIIVLSGYNVMIVAEGILHALSRVPRSAALVLASFAIIAFVVAAGASSSAVRAGIMAVLALIARGTGRTYDVLRALCAALFIMVALNPPILVDDPGFQFSFAATVGLILISPVISVRMLWISSVSIRELLATTLAAQVAVLPLLLWQSGNLSLVAVPANMLILPVVPAAMGLSAIAAGIAWAVPFLGPLAGLPAYACLWWIIEIARVAAKLPLAQIILPPFSFSLVLVSYALLTCAVVWCVKHPPQALRQSR
jgi:competence protein ComEC